jgi:hypothetical protein
MPEIANWLVWSYEHSAWWGPDHRGYTNSIARAGLYTEAQARQIQDKANWLPPQRGDGQQPVINEQAIPLLGNVEPLLSGHPQTDQRLVRHFLFALQERQSLLEKLILIAREDAVLVSITETSDDTQEEHQ